AKAKYLDAKLPIDKRVADLLARMTLEEKIAQLHGYWFPKSGVMVDDQLRPALGNDKARALLAHGLGEISRPSENEDRKKNLGPRQEAELTNALQKYVIEQTRLGIPLLNHEEGLHGMQGIGATSFPQPIALAASFDPALVEEVMTVVAKETRARGAHHTLAPVVDVMRDPRWGRAEETYGEDPYLVSRMGVAAVRGLQGRAPVGAKIDANHVMATLKHFAVHGQPEAGMNVGPNNYSERVIREVFFPPFRAAIKEAGARAIMPAYVEIDGVPATANKLFLQDILRKEWGFDGLVVSDYFAIEQLNSLHHVVDSDTAAAQLALESGVDLELPDPKLYPQLLSLVKSKAVPMALIDKSVARVLRAKFELGLFEQPYVDVEQADKIAGSPEHVALARKAADRSIVLLKNAGGLLPLDKTKVKTIAVVGPNAEPCRLGGYSGVPKHCVGVLRGIREAVGNAVKVMWAPGCGITRGNDWWADKVETPTPEEDRRMIDDAVAVARKADVVVLAVGDSEQSSREGWAPNHLGDRASLDLLGRQDDLARAILALGKPTVAVLLNGRPPSINVLAQGAGAILEGFYLGQEGGATVAAALFGDINPGGKLPVSFARSAGHLPIFYNHKPSARRGYLFDDVTPLYPFGHGLSYTTFAYKNLKVAAAPTKDDKDAQTVTVDVTNTGQRPGDEVAQLYLRDVVSSVTRPVKELKGFERVTLKPGETRTVSFTIGHDALGFWKTTKDFVVEPGKFDVTVGGSSAGGLTTSFELKGPAGKKPVVAAKSK
ncbi:MAG TPA: glycoside hydrolase family 3 N-terminal domain-containing protein, partial [Polyangia bacterium]|nr:glycoside hydrolase family 3 N-terminal domain-containing protein [Polyangia bacterium]